MTEIVKKAEINDAEAMTPEEREIQLQQEVYLWLDKQFRDQDRDHKDRLTYALAATMVVN